MSSQNAAAFVKEGGQRLRLASALSETGICSRAQGAKLACRDVSSLLVGVLLSACTRSERRGMPW
jgi:hypothetical protein